MLKKSLLGLLRILVFAVAFFIVLFFLLRMSDWSGPLRRIFLVEGDYLSLLYLLLFTFAIGYILKWLLKKEYRVQFVRRPKK